MRNIIACTPTLVLTHALVRLVALGNFIILKDSTSGLVNFPEVSATLAKKLQKWTGSKEQVTALAQGVATKKEAKQIYDFEWKLDVKAGDSFGTVKSQEGKVVKSKQQAGTDDQLSCQLPALLS